ncbi:MAG: dioxygenase [Alphaproteobacteria bacterium]|nr:dioxygenase [Alphaproteobacteria bacterium]
MTFPAAGAPPAVFVSHGAPTLLLEGGPAVAFLSGLGAQLGRPSAVVCVSAHWETAAPSVSAADRPETIHDFYGFPRALYAMRYPAPGAPALATRVRDALGEAGFSCAVDPRQGLDHGAWVPMKVMYPDADVPVLQLSVQPQAGAAHHLAIGRALAPLRRDGVLVLGSGSAIHNLRALRWGDAKPEDWAVGFADWLDARVAEGAVDELAHYRERSPGGVMAHPTDEHFLPLFAAMGAGGSASGRRLHSSFSHGNLGMQAYAWG